MKTKGVKAWGRPVDVADSNALRGWIEDANAALYGIDILVANASALSFGVGIEAFQAAFDVDLMHTVTAVEAAMPAPEVIQTPKPERRIVRLEPGDSA